VEAANLGLVNAGIDVFINEPMIQDFCAGAVVTVIQVLGAANMSNRFYAVHPRRNDRFPAGVQHAEGRSILTSISPSSTLPGTCSPRWQNALTPPTQWSARNCARPGWPA
jgi:hypothetical protein